MKRLLTTITTGRSGTHYLTEVMNASANCVADHESWPRPNQVLEWLNRGRPLADVARYAGHWSAMKALDVRWRCRNEHAGLAIGGRDWDQIDTWGDVSHVFGRCVAHPRWSPFVEAMGVQPGGQDHLVVHLRRDPRKVCESMLTYHGGPSDWPGGRHFACTPDHPLFGEAIGSAGWPDWRRWWKPDDGSLVPEHLPGRAALVLWEWCQIEALAELAKVEWPGRVHTVDLPELNTMDGIARLGEACGLQWREQAVADILGHRANKTASARRVRLDDATWNQARAILLGETGLEV